ncbi:response regulator transcription factor [Acidobacteria bacterium AB60]|nr:response regulator transcription factor [Acidobacteria bacterium AB60]
MSTQTQVVNEGLPSYFSQVVPWNLPTSGERGGYNPIAGRQVLIAADDLPLARFLQKELHAKSLPVHLVHDSQSTIDALAHGNYDLVILDLDGRNEGGVDLLRRVRKATPSMPILKLTAQNRAEDRVYSLENGADDCLSKPFSVLELSARVRCLLRRKVGINASVTSVADLVLNREEHSVRRGERRIDLTPREFAILEYLVRFAGRPISRATLVEEVWKTPYDATSNIVDVYVKYVRDKVDLPGERKLIHTIRGIGYTVSDER